MLVTLRHSVTATAWGAVSEDLVLLTIGFRLDLLCKICYTEFFMRSLLSG